MGDSSLPEVYVSKDGHDETGDGSASNPVATLAKAVALAAPGTADNPTEIYVMSDLTMTASARYWNKYISISSYGKDAPFTVTRGEFTKVEGDPARGSYNAAMIEVNGFTNNGVVSALRLTNIIFDDNGMYEGEYFLQLTLRVTEQLRLGRTKYSIPLLFKMALLPRIMESEPSPSVRVLFSKTMAECLLFASLVESSLWSREARLSMTTG